MPLYEHLFLARQDISPQQVEALTETLKSIISEGGGSVTKSEYWGLKSLAFKIKKNRKAHFTLFNLDAPHPAVAEMERQMSINEDIIRHLTLRVEKAEEGPSVMMRSRGGRDRDRDERRGRRDDRGPRDGDGDGEKSDSVRPVAAEPVAAEPDAAEPVAAEPVAAEPDGGAATASDMAEESTE